MLVAGKETPRPSEAGNLVMMRWRRRRMRNDLAGAYQFGAWVAHLPPWLDRGPDPKLHRAIRSAFMRGFVAESHARALPEAG